MTTISFTKNDSGNYSYVYTSDGSQRIIQLTTGDGPIAGITVEVRISSALPWVRLQKIRPADNSRSVAFAVSVQEDVQVRISSITPITQAAYVE